VVEDKTGSLRDDVRALFACPRELWLVYAATFLEYLGVFSFLQTLPMWLTSDHGMSDERAGWMAATWSTMLTLFVFVIGAVADTVGVRRTLIISFSLAAITRLAMSLAPTPDTAIIALFAFGLAFATTSPVLQTAVHRSATKRARAFAFSLWYVSFNLAGTVIGPFMIDPTRHAFIDPQTHKLASRIVSIPLLGPRPMTANGAIMAEGFVFAALAVVVVMMLRKGFEDRRDPEDEAPPKKAGVISALKDVITDKTFWRFIVLLVFLSIVRMMFQHMHFTWPKYVTRVEGDTFPVGTVWSLNSFLILFLAPLGTAITRKARPFTILLIGAFISSLSPFVLCFGSSMPFQIGMVVTLTIGEALWSPRLYEYNLSIAPRGREATYVALAALPYFLAKFLVGPTSGYLLASFCPEKGVKHVAIMWAIIGMITMVGPIGIWIGRAWMAKEEHATSS
jgi:MFS family permease